MGQQPSLKNPAATITAVLAVVLPAGSSLAQEEPATTTETAPLLPPVVVSASRVPLPSREIGSAVSVITEEQLEERQTRIVSDVLRDVPGVAVNRTGPPGALTQVRIRGAEGNQTLVRIDGIEVNNPASGSEFDFANLLQSGYERIEVLRGPQSALYGSDAIGGVVDLTSRNPEDGLSALGRVEGGSFGTFDGLAEVGYGAAQGYAIGTINRFSTDGISVADEANGNTEKDPFANTTGRIKAGFSPLDNLEFEGVGIFVDSERDGDASAPVVGAIDSADRSSTDQVYGLLKGTLDTFDDALEYIVRGTYVSSDSDFFDGDGNRTFRSNGEKTKFDYQANLRFDTEELVDAEHTAVFLFEREHEEQYTDSAFSGSNRVDITNYGYVGEYRVGLFESLFLSGSVRFDDNDELFDDQTTYRVTAAYLVEELGGTRFHSSVGRGVKNPTLFELFGATPNFTGNPNLEPEDAFGWDIGIEQPFLDERLLVDVTYFNTTIENLIQGAGNTAVNIDGESDIQGVEVSASVLPIEGLRLDLAYTYTDAEDADGQELVRRPKNVASFVANYAFDLAERPANLNLGIRYNGEQEDINFLNFFPLETERVTLDSYTLVDLRASWQVAEQIEIFARGENLLDEDYQEVFGFGTPGISGFAGIRIALGP